VGRWQLRAHRTAATISAACRQVTQDRAFWPLVASCRSSGAHWLVIRGVLDPINALAARAARSGQDALMKPLNTPRAAAVATHHQHPGTRLPHGILLYAH
jgi:hypothetical protein